MTVPVHLAAGREASVTTAAAAARALELRHLSIPIPDIGVSDDMQYDAITTAIEHALERGGGCVHPWAG